MESRFAEGLARDGAGVDAASAGIWRSLDDGDALSEIGGLRAGFFAGWSAADDDEIKSVTRWQDGLRRITPLNLGSVLPR